MSIQSPIDAKRSECWNNAVRAFGTAFILQRRAGRLRSKRRLLTFFAFVVPILVGIIATKVYTKSPVPDLLMHFASGASALLALISLWSVVAKWEDTLADCFRGAHKNYHLQVKWETLVKEDDQKVQTEYPVLLQADHDQRESDIKHVVSSREKIVGMRAALFKYGPRTCAGCKQKPSSEAIPWTIFRKKCKVCGEPL